MLNHIMPFGERRLHLRKSCSRTVVVLDSNKSFAAHLRDLSLGGAMIEPPSEIKSKIGQKYIITIPYGLKNAEVTINAEIAWIRPHGIGVRFVRVRQHSVS
jgi:hypothetical protein